MRTVNIGVATVKQAKASLKAAFKGVRQGEHINFTSLELMHRVLTPNRWAILRTLMKRDEVGVRELARMLDRDVKGVHGDIVALADAGVIERADDGSVSFPYDAIHVEFDIAAV